MQVQRQRRYHECNFFLSFFLPYVQKELNKKKIIAAMNKQLKYEAKGISHKMRERWRTVTSVFRHIGNWSLDLEVRRPEGATIGVHRRMVLCE